VHRTLTIVRYVVSARRILKSECDQDVNMF